MAIEEVRKHLKKWGRDVDILELEASGATVELAAKTLEVEAARIAKTISFKYGESALLIVAAGDAKTDSRKFKDEFGIKARMLTPEDALEYTGHPVGGICPFGLKSDLPVFLDISLRRFDSVFPACGSTSSAIKVTCTELEEYSSNQKWVDVCKGWQESE